MNNNIKTITHILNGLNVQFSVFPFYGAYDLDYVIFTQLNGDRVQLQLTTDGYCNIVKMGNNSVHFIISNGTVEDVENVILNRVWGEDDDLPMHLELDTNHSDLLSDMED